MQPPIRGNTFASVTRRLVFHARPACMAAVSSCCAPTATSCLWERLTQRSAFLLSRCKLAALEKAFFDKQEARFDAKYIGVLVEGRPASIGLSSPAFVNRCNGVFGSALNVRDSFYNPKFVLLLQQKNRSILSHARTTRTTHITCITTGK
jgi:hypothetical protein